VQNLSEEVETEAFYEFFSKFGEILQCKTDTDNYGQVRHSTAQLARHHRQHHRL
jgi:RNA recognition motif-containing protein